MTARKLAGLMAMAGMAFSAPATAASLFIQGGQLAGVNGLDVNGTVYNVRFVDGTCSAIYSGCDDPSDFDFTSTSAAGQAMTELGNFVRYTSPWSNDPELTVGCEDEVRCYWVAPFAERAGNILLQTWTNAVGTGDYSTVSSLLPSYDTSANSSYVFAKFSQASGAVPEPSSWLLMLTAFFGVGMVLRQGARRAALA